MASLIVEIGYRVAGANSYNSFAALRSYALLRGNELSDDDDVLLPHLVKATDYLELFRQRYRGELIADDQPLAFPRKRLVTSDGREISSTIIPFDLTAAHAELAVQSALGLDILPVREAGYVQSRSVLGPITDEFDTALGYQPVTIPRVNVLLAPLLRANGMKLRADRG